MTDQPLDPREWPEKEIHNSPKQGIIDCISHDRCENSKNPIRWGCSMFIYDFFV